MAPVVSTTPSDVKLDIEASAPLLGDKTDVPPQYPIDESAEVLVVGAPEQGRCFMGRRFCHRAAGAQCERKKRGRFARFCRGMILMTMFLILMHTMKVVMFGRTGMHHKFRGYFGGSCHAKPLHCELIDPSTSTASITADFLPADTKVLLQESITSGDLHITRNPGLAANTLELQLDLSRPNCNKETQGESMVCFVKKRHGVSVGLYTRNNEGAPLTARSATIALSPDSAGISFQGHRHFRHKGRHSHKLWKWFDRKQAEKTAEVQA